MVITYLIDNQYFPFLFPGEREIEGQLKIQVKVKYEVNYFFMA